jgi:hypothetical protein
MKKIHSQASVLSPKYEVFCCDQNGPPARREEGAYLDRYVTDEQRSRRPIFIATLWAMASWLFFRVARSTRMTQIWALRSRLEKQPTDLRQNTSYFGDRTLAGEVRRDALLTYGIRGFPEITEPFTASRANSFWVAGGKIPRMVEPEHPVVPCHRFPPDISNRI